MSELPKPNQPEGAALAELRRRHWSIDDVALAYRSAPAEMARTETGRRLHVASKLMMRAGDVDALVRYARKAGLL